MSLCPEMLTTTSAANTLTACTQDTIYDDDVDINLREWIQSYIRPQINSCVRQVVFLIVFA